jgi:signal transduction histidine kinase
MSISRAKAVGNLESPDSLVRLEAARTLVEKGLPKDRGALGRALTREHDPWVRRELGLAIRAIARSRPRNEVAELTVEARVDQLRATVTEELSELLLHEIRPLVGAAKLAARGEVDPYETSETKRALDRLSDLLEALGHLNRAAMAPVSVDDFDIAEVAAQLLRSLVGPDCDIERLLAGPQPAPVSMSRALFETIVMNGLRNALESVKQRGEAGPCEGVVVNWGTTDSDYWLTVTDDGVGLPDSSDQFFEVGHSSKPKDTNFGLGLAIARRAARSMGGDVNLRQAEAGGAVFEVRWSKDG